MSLHLAHVHLSGLLILKIRVSTDLGSNQHRAPGIVPLLTISQRLLHLVHVANIIVLWLVQIIVCGLMLQTAIVSAIGWQCCNGDFLMEVQSLLCWS